METTMADKKPGSANEVLASVNDDHDWRHEPTDLTTTGGIKRSCERNAAAIQALADFIDGKSTRAMPGYEAPAAVKGETRTAEQVRLDQQTAEQARNQNQTPTKPAYVPPASPGHI